MLLAFCGGALSLLVAYATAGFAVSLIPAEDGGLRIGFSPDARTLFGTFAVTLLTALVFGLYPALRGTRVDAAPALKEGAGSVGGAHGSAWLTPGKALVFAQVSLGVLLLGAAALFNSHLQRILANETGFERTRLLLFDLRPGQAGHLGPKLRQFYFDLEQRLRDVPGVEAAGFAHVRPMRGGGYWDQVKFGGSTPGIDMAVNFVTADYLNALGVKVVAGRGFTAGDIRDGATVAVVSEDLGKAIGPQPLGVTFRHGDQLYQIVGIAARARYEHVARQPNVLYLPHRLDKDTLTVMLRSQGSPMQMIGPVREAVRSLDANLPLVDVFTMEQQISNLLRRERLFAWLCGAFGLLALVLCMVGLYGVMTYAAARRGPEMGIRMALGASPGHIVRHIAGEGMAVTLAGLAAGAPVAWWAARKFVDFERFGMEPLAPGAVAWPALALAVAAAVAVAGPAWRAASADPAKVLRQG
jgi:predicted permease